MLFVFNCLKKKKMFLLKTYIKRLLKIKTNKKKTILEKMSKQGNTKTDL